MATHEKNSVTIKTTIHAPVAKVWEYWTDPAHIVKWNSASEDWHTPSASNDLRVEGRFTSRMEARDGSQGFDFGGVYTAVDEHARIEYTMDDNRTVKVLFDGDGETTHVTETFDTENTFPVEVQRAGWQSILDSFKKYTEEN